MTHTERIDSYLREHDARFIPNEIVELLPKYGMGDVCMTIVWGDWKHDHAHIDYLMKNLGYKLVNEEVTEENGSDCYSSDHYYTYQPN